MRVVLTSLVGLGFFLSGVGASAQTAERVAAPAVPLGARPASVTRFCVDRARRDKFTVLCPSRYPRTSQSEVTPSGSSLLGPSFYWASFNDAAGFGNGDNGHLVFGGQRPRFSLAGSPGQTWPRPGVARPLKQLNLPRLLMTPMQDGRQFVAQRPARVLRRATVNAGPALVLVAEPYPLGGFMAGHVIVLWNRQQHGYMLSLHFDGAPNGQPYSLGNLVAAALQVAGSFAPSIS